MDRATVQHVLAAVRRRWPLALLILVVVLGVDIAITMTRPRTYLARATMVVSPSASVDRGQLVYSVDSLGRGRIVGTFAEVLGSDVVQREAAARLNVPTTAPSESPSEVVQREVGTILGVVAPGLNILSAPPAAPRQWLIVRSSVVAESAVIQVLAESLDPEVSSAAANIVGEIGIEQLASLYPVYSLTFLSQAQPPTAPYRPDVLRNYALGLIVGLALAIVAAYLVDLALQGRSERRRSVRQSTGGNAVHGPASGSITVPDGGLRHTPPGAVSRVAFTSGGVEAREGSEAHDWHNDVTAPASGEAAAAQARPVIRNA